MRERERDSIQQAMRAHCPNYNEASYFFRAERSRSICPRLRRLDDSGPLPGLFSRFETKCKRIVGTSPSSRIGQNERDCRVRKRRKEREREDSPRERRSFPTHSWYRPIFLPSSHDSFIPRRMRSDRRSLPASSSKTPANHPFFGSFPNSIFPLFALPPPLTGLKYSSPLYTFLSLYTFDRVTFLSRSITSLAVRSRKGKDKSNRISIGAKLGAMRLHEIETRSSGIVLSDQIRATIQEGGLTILMARQNIDTLAALGKPPGRATGKGRRGRYRQTDGQHE